MKKPVNGYVAEYPAVKAEESYYGNCETNNTSCDTCNSGDNSAGSGNGSGNSGSVNGWH